MRLIILVVATKHQGVHSLYPTNRIDLGESKILKKRGKDRPVLLNEGRVVNGSPGATQFPIVAVNELLAKVIRKP